MGIVDSNMNDYDEMTSQDDVCTYMGILPLPPNTISNEKIQCIQHQTYPMPSSSSSSSSVGKTTFIGILRTNTKHIDIYLVRDYNESLKKKIRRLRRKREKGQKKENEKSNETKRGKKRGILDADEDEEEDQQQVK